jgi:hypothetical protein
MGNKDKGKKETKKPPKPKSKATPNKREGFSQPAVRIVNEATKDG